MDTSSAPDGRRRPHRTRYGVRRRAIWEKPLFLSRGRLREILPQGLVFAPQKISPAGRLLTEAERLRLTAGVLTKSRSPGRAFRAASGVLRLLLLLRGSFRRLSPIQPVLRFGQFEQRGAHFKEALALLRLRLRLICNSGAFHCPSPQRGSFRRHRFPLRREKHKPGGAPVNAAWNRFPVPDQRPVAAVHRTRRRQRQASHGPTDEAWQLLPAPLSERYPGIRLQIFVALSGPSAVRVPSLMGHTQWWGQVSSDCQKI